MNSPTRLASLTQNCCTQIADDETLQVVRIVPSNLNQLSTKDLRTLLDKRYSKPQTSSSLLEILQPLIEKYERTRIQQISRRLVPILSHIGSFAAIVNVYIQADPTVSSLIWGSVCLLISVKIYPHAKNKVAPNLQAGSVS